MKQNEGTQLKAFVSFIKNNNKMHTALQNQEWADFARLYNGPGYAKNKYDKLLQDSYMEFKNE